MDRFVVLIPATVLAAYMLTAFAVYVVLCALGKRPELEGVGRRRFTELFGPFLIRYFLWVLRPFERFAIRCELRPNTITLMSLFGCGSAGLSAATGHYALAAWLYIGAGALDILDGRLARATNQSSQSGAFLDSVLDRWGELFVLAGYAWALRASWGLMASFAAVAGSMMVSYTRARGEGLGIRVDGGTMQRAERIAIISVGTMVAAYFDAIPATEHYVPDILGGALVLVGAAASTTAISRLIAGYRALRREDDRGAARAATAKLAATKAKAAAKAKAKAKAAASAKA